MWGLVVGGLIVWGARVVRIPKEVRGDSGVRISHFPYSVLPPPVLFCPFVSRLPPFIVFLPLSCKSRCLTSYSNREGVLWPSVRNKKLCCKSNHSALSSAIIEAAFLRHKFTPRGKIFSVLWTTVVRSELPGRSSMDGFFPTTQKYRDRSEWSRTCLVPRRLSFDENVCAKEGGKVVFDLTTFDLTRFVVLTENFDS